MDPFTFLIGLSLAGYVIGGVVTDAIAVSRKMPAPSHEKWKARHEAKQQRGEHSDPNPSYVQRLIGNAVERWATRSDQRHRDKLAWIEEQAPNRSARWLERKRRRADRYGRAAQAVADRAGVLWGKTRDAAERARERRAETRAWRENERRDQRDGDAGLDIVDTDGGIDEHGRGHPRQWQSDHGSGWELPVVYDDDGTAWYVHPDGSRSIAEEDLAAMDRVMDEMDAETGPDNVVPFQRPTDQQEDTTTSTPDNDSDRTAELNQPATIPAADVPSQEGLPMMADTANPEITSLSEAQTYTGNMTTSLEQIQAQVDSWSAELTGLADQAEQASVEAEQAIASLRAREVEGDHLARMEAARDEFTAIAAQFRSASEAVGQASGSAEAGAAAFRAAHDAFEAQTSLGEEMQAAEASGNGPGDREFYLNG